MKIAVKVKMKGKGKKGKRQEGGKEGRKNVKRKLRK